MRNHKLFYLCITLACASAALAPAQAESGDWLIRTRALLVAPTEKSGGVLPDIPGGSVSVENAMTGEIDFTYFFTRHIAYEAVVGYPSHHSIYGEGDIEFLGEFVGTDAMASMGVVQFHPLPDARVRPYAGIGFNWTNFFFEHESASLIAAFGPTKVTIDDSFGVVFQAGADIAITERVFFNIDAKYLDIDTTGVAESATTTNSVAIALDPFIFGVGFGAKF